MDDAGLVTRFESCRNLSRYGDRFIDGDSPLLDPLGKRRSFDELENERFYAVRVFETVDARDVRVIQRREQFRFTLETRQALVVAGELFGKDFDRDVAIELRIAGAVHLPHAACADGRDDLIDAEFCSCGERHV